VQRECAGGCERSDEAFDRIHLGHWTCVRGLGAIDSNSVEILGTISLMHNGWVPQRGKQSCVYIK
jgi:hypothetical protein